MEKTRENTLSRLTGLILDEMGRQDMAVKDLAKGLNVSKQYASKLLNGGMNYKYFCLICDLLGMHVQLIPNQYV